MHLYFPPHTYILLCFSTPPPSLSSSFPFTIVHSDVSPEFLLLDASEGSIKGNDRACIPLFFSFCLALPFALLRMADYLSLHGLSGADRRLSWRGRQSVSRREDPVSPRALTSLTTIQSTQMHSWPALRSPQVI